MKCWPMTAVGHQPTFAPQKAMSALPPEADIRADIRDVGFVPKAEISGNGSKARGPAPVPCPRGAGSRGERVTLKYLGSKNAY